MQYANGTDSIVDDARYWSGTNSTTYPIADLTRNANQALDRVTSLILRSDNSWEWDDTNATSSQLINTSTALVSGTSQYAITATWLRILRVRAKDPSGNWITLTPVSRRDLSDSKLASSGTPNSYDKLGNLIILNPIPNYASTGGLEVQFQRAASFFTTASTTTEPGFASQFHRLISLYAALDYCEINGLEKRAAAIRKRIGNPPSAERGIVGNGLEGELVDFYTSRDYDRPHSLNVSKEDYGQAGLSGGSNDLPKGFSI